MHCERLFETDSYLQSCDTRIGAVHPGAVELESTVFYPEGGGQPGDSGTLTLADGRVLRVMDTRKGEAPGAILHRIEDLPTDLMPGQLATARIDWERRHRHMRMHTCLHLLCTLVDAGVTGGSISADKARLDFDLPEATLNKEDLSARLNELINRDRPVGMRWITDAELDAAPELVRTMSVRPPRGSGQVRLIEVEGIDLQPCGGTHVARIGEIGAVVVSKIEKKGRQNRRVIVRFAQ
ncbi:alanyl-tRNA editing protein [Acidihalobacter ferrooxydans]|uniref:Alanine--tRNA ligase n=1 Tax=Acidihalobacter ferrooxydans TaxID=1765967 RepID=A0A1P8UDF9_9GAMM|nr:alanyl-tRNA editing protein [Acidihalobacter ferrooxydans]APZ41824.1 Ala-tRNA(Pro) hydrolase [Acidihalobacter ferrooxydans]